MAQRKPYNPYTKYGRTKLREQARYNYENGSQEYKNDIDKTGRIVWGIAIFIAIIFFLIIAATKGGDAALKWLSR